jgi:hypothetical protein
MTDFKEGDILKGKGCDRYVKFERYNAVHINFFTGEVVNYNDVKDLAVGLVDNWWIVENFELAEPAKLEKPEPKEEEQQAEFCFKVGDKFMLKDCEFVIIKNEKGYIFQSTREVQQCLNSRCEKCKYTRNINIIDKEQMSSHCTSYEFQSLKDVTDAVHKIKAEVENQIQPKPESKEQVWAAGIDFGFKPTKTVIMKSIQSGATTAIDKLWRALPEILHGKSNPESEPEEFDWFGIYRVDKELPLDDCPICNGSGIKRIYPLLEPTGMKCKCIKKFKRYYYKSEMIECWRSHDGVIKVEFVKCNKQEVLDLKTKEIALDFLNSIPFKNEEKK